MTTSSNRTGLCPRCRGVQNFSMNIERQAVAEGNTIKIVEVETAHCECCGSFVYREEHAAEQAK
jgi:hypothetical protein